MTFPRRATAVRRSVPAAALLLAAAGLLQATAAQAREFTGLVHARHDLILSVGVPGIVARVPVVVGQRVEARAPLLYLDERIQATEVQRRKVTLDDMSELRATEERVRTLAPLYEDTRKLLNARGAVSREEVARLELELVTARGRLAQLQAQKTRERMELTAAEQDRDQRRLTAPVAGVVTRVDTDVGEWAKPGDALIQLVDADTGYLKLNLPPAAALPLKRDAEVPVRFDATTGIAPIRAKVSYVAPVIDPASGLVEVRLAFANPKGAVPSGIKGIVDLPEGGR
ncbi:efflux RND transporter periplasmic adaptor subunit [uncultured Pseudacidovorax sp.]|uniref:efflux RND transporter periplasmic adaptor subunit n=1 Tax=uncultured Pseudacidovorax sp. TaxID=679313 RepID=UPI0025DFA826|nr:efflux RND transporter periplasmic adaptor subunit [uncultured Pseudacidovorax sp.]